MSDVKVPGDDSEARVEVDAAGPCTTVETTRFGPIEVALDRLISLPRGIPGFDDLRRILLIEVDPDKIFWWIQSADDPALAFLAVVPWPYFGDYEPNLPEQDRVLLDLSSADEAQVLCLVTTHHDPDSFTANLLGPVIVNSVNRTAAQVVLTDGDYSPHAELV